MHPFRIGSISLGILIVIMSSFSMAQSSSPIRRAIEQEDLAKIRTAVEQDKKVLQRSLPQFGMPPLHYAINKGKLEAVKVLLDLQAPTDANNDRKLTALHAALARNNQEIIELILAKTNDVNGVDRNRSTPLMYAVMYRQIGPEWIQRLIDKGAEVNWKNGSQQTPLHVASYYGREECGKQLIEAGADLSAVDNNENTPLLAASATAPNLVRQMLAKGADPLVQNRQGQTALHLACQSGRSEIPKLIIDRFENVDVPDKQNRTPLWMAVFAENLETVQMLLDRGANPNRFNSINNSNSVPPPLAYAAAIGNRKMVRMLAEAGGDVNAPNQDGDRPLHLAAQASGNIFGQQTGNPNAGQPFVATIEVLLKYQANPNLKNRSGQTPLQVAAQRDFFAAVERLVDQTDAFDFDAGAATPIHWAAKNGLLKTAKRLVKLGQSGLQTTDNAGRTPILVAAANGHADVVEFLIRNKADFGHADQEGLTPVLLAAAGGHDAVLRELLKAGADVLHKDASGQSALHLAAWNGASKFVAELIEYKPLLELKTPTGYTALHAAAWNGHADVVKLLLKAGADPNAQDSDGWTPLHKAAYRGHANSVKALLASGADKDRVTGTGMTARAMAEDNQKTEVVTLLK